MVGLKKIKPQGGKNTLDAKAFWNGLQGDQRVVTVSGYEEP